MDPAAAPQDIGDDRRKHLDFSQSAVGRMAAASSVVALLRAELWRGADRRRPVGRPAADHAKPDEFRAGLLGGLLGAIGTKPSRLGLRQVNLLLARRR